MTEAFRLPADSLVLGGGKEGGDRMTEQDIQERFSRIAGHLNEQAKRLWCANEALGIGWGGITRVAKATGLSRTTISVGVEELLGIRSLPDHGIRRPGGGRKKNH